MDDVFDFDCECGHCGSCREKAAQGALFAEVGRPAVAAPVPARPAPRAAMRHDNDSDESSSGDDFDDGGDGVDDDGDGAAVVPVPAPIAAGGGPAPAPVLLVHRNAAEARRARQQANLDQWRANQAERRRQRDADRAARDAGGLPRQNARQRAQAAARQREEAGEQPADGLPWGAAPRDLNVRLLTVDDPRAPDPPGFKGRLHPPQATLLAAMVALERCPRVALVRAVVNGGHCDPTLQTRVARVPAEFAFGKTVTSLALIAATRGQSAPPLYPRSPPCSRCQAAPKPTERRSS